MLPVYNGNSNDTVLDNEGIQVNGTIFDGLSDDVNPLTTCQMVDTFMCLSTRVMIMIFQGIIGQLQSRGMLHFFGGFLHQCTNYQATVRRNDVHHAKFGQDLKKSICLMTFAAWERRERSEIRLLEFRIDFGLWQNSNFF